MGINSRFERIFLATDGSEASEAAGVSGAEERVLSETSATSRLPLWQR